VEKARARAPLIPILATLQKESKRALARDSFETRLRLQKTVYLLKAAGFPEAAGFRFNYYIRGPYSSDLAAAYYSWDTDTLTDIPRLSDARLSSIAQAITRGNDFLEATSALHWIQHINRGVDRKRVFEIGANLKPRLADLFPEAWKFLQDSGLLA
jgi:hypothetical protein